MKYEINKHKIRKIWEEVNKQDNELNKFKKFESKKIILNYSKTKNKYIIEEKYDFTTSYGFDYSVYLNNFPEKLLPFLKLILIFSSTDAYGKNLQNEIITQREFDNLPLDSSRDDKYYINCDNRYVFRAVTDDKLDKKRYFIEGSIVTTYYMHRITWTPSVWKRLPLYGNLYLYIINPRWNK